MILWRPEIVCHFNYSGHKWHSAFDSSSIVFLIILFIYERLKFRDL